MLKESAKYLNVIVAGGKVALPIVGDVDILGLRNARSIIEAAIAGLPKDAPERVALEQVSRFAGLAADNLDLSKPILASISKPVQVKQIVVSGSNSSLSAFAAEAAVVGSMMFVALLLAAGMLALEREENAFGRLVRGLISRTGLVVEKVSLAGLAAFVLTAVMLAILAALLGFDFGRAPLWLVVLAFGSAAFGAMGVAIGGLTREVRSASLAAFVVSLPVAALALIPSGAVSEGLYDVIKVVSARLPVPALPRRARRRHQRRLPPHAPAPPRRADARLRRDRAALAASLRLAPTTIGAWPSPPPACAASAPPPASATWCGRRSWPRGTSSTRCSSCTARTAGRRSRPCRGSTTSRSATRCRRPARPPRSASRPCCCSGCPAAKDEEGSGAWDDEGVIQLATRAIKAEHPDLLVITDLCLCEYTSHGHCGVLRADGVVDNDATLELLARTAVSQAAAGADAVAPSDMMDGRVGALRTALDEHDLSETPIIAYSAKFASAFYGPFREAADSAPQRGDRRGYQMDPANALEAEREAELDAAEGADVVMVKPALPYLDVIRRVKERTRLPVAAYNVSGEYAMIKAAAAAGLLDERAAVLEALTGIRRAGADIVITYHAKDVARWLQ